MQALLRNPAISRILTIKVDDFEGLADFAATNQVGLTIVGPEQPLVDGIVDFFQRVNYLFLVHPKALLNLKARRPSPKIFSSAIKFQPLAMATSRI